MTDIISLFKSDIYNGINYLESKNIIKDFNKNNLSIDFSSKSKQGDLSTNIFLVLSKKKIDNNFDLKDYLYNFFNNLDYVSDLEIAKAGFINIFIKKKFILLKLKNLPHDTDKRNIKFDNKENVNIEFVSANPSGPIHIAHMRGAVLGDVMASILESVGNKVTREYYVNDAGSQITILGNSLFKRYQELFDIKVVLKDGEYPGDYLIDIAKLIKKIDGNKWLDFKHQKLKDDYFQNFGVRSIIAGIKEDLSSLNINFDKFSYESEIVKKNLIVKVFNILKENNLIYEGVLEKPLGINKEVWQSRKQLLFRSTNFSDDSDRPFKKSNGEWTYFANDSAYHYDKYLRGFDKLINVWGADHIGYISRMKSITDVVSKKKNYLDILVCQIVKLIKNGENLKMSKRDGNFITLNQIFKEVGRDALRYFMISSKSETPMDFDMNKVIEKNKDNPVFYCQYAYARASSVIKKAEDNLKIPNLNLSYDLIDISHISKYEWDIILKLLSWPYILKLSADTKQPHRITNYLENLCSSFHSFWNKGKDDESLRFIDENNINKTLSKLIWINSFKHILNKAFNIIGIDSPEQM